MFTATACGGQPSMSRADARSFARQALLKVGFTNVAVDRAVTLASYRSPDARFKNQKAVQVWQTHSTVPEGTVDLYVPRKGNSAVFVRDEATADRHPAEPEETGRDEQHPGRQDRLEAEPRD